MKMKSVLIKTIPGYEFYSDGRIWYEKEQRFLDGWDDDGYNRVTVNGITKSRQQWIGLMFMKNPDNKPELHHINGNRQDNRVSNLMYVTRSEHMLIHAEEWGIPVYQYTLDGAFVAEYKSVNDAASCLKADNEKVSGKNIRACCIGVIKTAYGYQWSYERHPRIAPIKARYERMGESKCKSVEMCDMNWNHICFFNSVKEASEKTGALPTSIANNCRGASKSVLVNGVKHRFRYINKEPQGI